MIDSKWREKDMNGFVKSLVFVCLSLPIYSANAVSLFVEKWGSDNAECSRTEPCNEITTALNIATSNDRIFVGPGRYDGGLLIQETGIRLESTAGPRATIIDADRVGSGTIGVDIQADRVSIGRAGGRGFTILATDAEVIRVGLPETITGCAIESLTPQGQQPFFFASEIIGTLAQNFSGTRVEGNNLFQFIQAAPPLVGDFCTLDDFDNPTAAVLLASRVLNAVSVTGDGVILNDNNIVGAGTHVLNLSETSGRSTIQGNNIKQDLTVLNNLPAADVQSSDGFSTRSSALTIEGGRSTIRDNLFELIGSGVGSDSIVFSDGIDSSGDRNLITSNIVLGFDLAINASPFGVSPVTTVSRNIIVNPSFAGITDFRAGAAVSITDNTIFAEEFSEAFARGLGIFSSNSRLIRGNNISGFNGAFATGLSFEQISPSQFFDVPVNFTTVSNNNFYDLNEDSGNGGSCGVFISSGGVDIRMTNNFFGSTTDLPQIIESTDNFFVNVTQLPAVSDSSNICAANGLVENVNGSVEITNVSTRPRLRANPIRAIFRDNPF